MIAGISGLEKGTALSAEALRNSPAETAPNAGADLFGELLKSSIGNITQLEQQARTAAEGLMTGSGVDVHQAMIAAEKASMAFELALAVRNKAIQSYQSVMSMQF